MTNDKSSRIRQWIKNDKKPKRLIFIVLILAALFITGRAIEIDKYLKIVQEWVWQFGSWGAVFYAFIYIGATLMMLPGTPFTILAALLFGSLAGFLTMVAATTISAIIAFVAARYIAREALEKRIAGAEKFKDLKKMVEKNHWFAIPFVRLMPIFPFSVNNYALGLTRISFWRYLLFSEFIFIPMNAVLVFGANTLYSAMTGGEISWWIAEIGRAHV